MEYSLAKQLKDAGFPQKEKGFYFRVGTSLTSDSRGENIIYSAHDCYVPTLGELIEACVVLTSKENEKVRGDGDFHLEHLHGEWAASVCYVYSADHKSGNWHEDHWHVGKTPKEAVARLWIALNKTV